MFSSSERALPEELERAGGRAGRQAPDDYLLATLNGGALINHSLVQHKLNEYKSDKRARDKMSSSSASIVSAEEEEFIKKSAQFFKEFDSLAENLFCGQQMEQLALKFIKIHESYLKQIAWPLSELHPTKASWMDFVKDDFRLLSLEPGDERESSSSNNNAELKSARQRLVYKTIAQVYCRAAKASYFRVTFNFCRKRQEDDRQVPVDWARRAIRFDSSDFEVAYWFMIATGWLTEGLPNGKEKIIVSQIFKLSTLRCIELRAEDPLAHHLLGRYFYSVGQLSWFERTIIKTLLLQDPNKQKQFKIEGSFAEAEQKFRHAHALKDDWPPTGLWMARCLLAQKKALDEVAQWIEMGLAHDCKEPTTELEREQLLELKAKLKLNH